MVRIHCGGVYISTFNGVEFNGVEKVWLTVVIHGLRKKQRRIYKLPRVFEVYTCNSQIKEIKETTVSNLNRIMFRPILTYKNYKVENIWATL